MVTSSHGEGIGLDSFSMLTTISVEQVHFSQKAEICGILETESALNDLWSTYTHYSILTLWSMAANFKTTKSDESQLPAYICHIPIHSDLMHFGRLYSVLLIWKKITFLIFLWEKLLAAKILLLFWGIWSKCPEY